VDTEHDAPISMAESRRLLWQLREKVRQLTAERDAARAELAAIYATEPVAWARIRKRDGFIRGSSRHRPDSEDCEMAEMEGEEYLAMIYMPPPGAAP